LLLWSGVTSDLTADSSEIVEILGVRIPLDEAVMSPKIRDQLRAGRYETAEARRLPALIEPGERLVELGAGIGFLTALAGLQGKAERIVAVEASPAVVPLIERVHRLNGVDSIVRNAVAVIDKASDTLPFHIHEDLWASSLLPIKPRLERGVAQVPVLGLAEILAADAPTLLVVDIEVLRAWVAGSPDLAGLRLPGVRKLLIELKPGRFEPRQIKAIFDAVSAEGFHYDVAVSEGPLVLFRRLEE
jgi:FkbM family methyltransferase